MKRYLICSPDESVLDFPPKAVVANNSEEALTRYLKLVYSRDEVFRETVFDLSINMSFLERFCISTDQEISRFNLTSESGTEFEIVESRIRSYFASRPDLGYKYLCYLKAEDRSLLDDEVFEFIALNESGKELSFCVIDPDTIEIVA